MDGFKGFPWESLAPWGVRREGTAVVVPFFGLQGKFYRAKKFPLRPRPDGPRSWWAGDSRPQIPYGLETLALGGRRVFLTEGESDAWALRLANPTAPVLGLPGASSWKPEWAVALEPFEAVYAIFDGDKAGDKLYDAVCSTIPRARVVFPIRDRDTRDLIQMYGTGVLREMVRVADADYAQRVKLDPLAGTMVTFPSDDVRATVRRHMSPRLAA